MANITTDTIIVNYDEVTLKVDYEVYESKTHQRIVFNTEPLGLTEQAILNAIEEHLKMKKEAPKDEGRSFLEARRTSEGEDEAKGVMP